MIYEKELKDDTLWFNITADKSISLNNYESFKQFISADDGNLDALKADIRENLPRLLADEMDLMDTGTPDVQLEAHAYMKVMQAVIQSVYSKSVEDENIRTTNAKDPAEVLVRLEDLPQ